MDEFIWEINDFSVRLQDAENRGGVFADAEVARIARLSTECYILSTRLIERL